MLQFDETEHTAAAHPQEGIDYYWMGHLVVFTEHWHLKRGYCCGMGCKHCPYDYESVPEPRRSELLTDEKKNPL